MRQKIKVNGVYSSNALKTLREQGISSISFDCRPRSFNFTQAYKVQEILQEQGDGISEVFLNFQDEKNFVIQKIVQDIESVRGGTNLFLEFSDQQKFEFYDSLKYPFYWHFSHIASLALLTESEYLKGVVLPFEIIEREQAKGTLNTFYRDIVNAVANRQDTKLVLALDWDSNIFPSLLDIFEFDYISLSINQKVETSYRNLDDGKFHRGISYFKEIRL